MTNLERPNGVWGTILLPIRFNLMPYHMNNIHDLQEPYDPDLQEAIRLSLEE